jgi:hypothetical protein
MSALKNCFNSNLFLPPATEFFGGFDAEAFPGF